MTATSAAPVSPKAARLGAPRWLDGRLVLGVLLVLVSALVGAKVLATAETSQRVWVAARDLAPGTVLAEGDLRLGKVRLFDTSKRYLTGNQPVGYVVQRSISRDELLPEEALAEPGKDLPRRDVTVPVAVGHLPPDLGHGQQVDVYVTPDDKAARRGPAVKGVDPFAPRLVLQAVTVDRVVRAGGLGSSGQDLPVVLSVSPDQVIALIKALSEGRIDLVRVPRSQQAPLVTATEAP